MHTVNLVPIQVFKWKARVVPERTPYINLPHIVDNIIDVDTTLALTL